MIQVIGVNEILTKLEARSLKGRKTVAYGIGFSAPYAVFVHENLENYHKPPTQAKFLETAAKTKADEAVKEIARFVKTKHGLEHGIVSGARIILEEAKRLCPVDTGFLKSSGYVTQKPVKG